MLAWHYPFQGYLTTQFPLLHRIIYWYSSDYNSVVELVRYPHHQKHFQHFPLCESFIMIRARFLSLSENVLSNCLSQDRSETVLRSLASSLSVSVYDRIQVQILLNILTFIRCLIFLTASMFLQHFIFRWCILYFEIIAVLLNTWFCFICLIQPIWYFLIVCDVTCDTLVTPLQLSQNMLRQFQVTGYADLAHVYDRVTKTETENEIILAKSDIRFLLSKTVLWQR